MPHATRNHLLHVKPPGISQIDYEKNSVHVTWVSPVIPNVILYHGQEYTWTMLLQCDHGEGGEGNFRDIHECFMDGSHEYKMARLNCCYWFRLMIRIKPVVRKNRKLQHLEEVLERHGKPLPSNLAKNEPKEYWSANSIIPSVPYPPKICGIGRNVALQWLQPDNCPSLEDSFIKISYSFEKRISGCENELNPSNTRVYNQIHDTSILVEDLAKNTEYTFRLKVSLFHNESAWSKWTTYFTRPQKLNIKYIYANKFLALKSFTERNSKETEHAILHAVEEKIDTNENQLAVLEFPKPLDPFGLLAKYSLKAKYRIEGKHGNGNWKVVQVVDSSKNLEDSLLFHWCCPRKHHFGDLRVNVSLDLRKLVKENIICTHSFTKSKKINRFWDTSLPMVFISDLQSNTYSAIYEEGKEIKEQGSNKVHVEEGKWKIQIDWNGLTGVNNDILNANQVAMNPHAFKPITRSNIFKNSVLIRKSNETSLDLCKEVPIKEASGITSTSLSSDLIEYDDTLESYTDNLCAISYCTPITNVKRISPWLPILLAPTPKFHLSLDGKKIDHNIKQNSRIPKTNVTSKVMGTFSIDNGIEYVKSAIKNGAKNLELFYQISTYSVVTLKKESIKLLHVPLPSLTDRANVTEEERNLVVHHPLLKGRKYEVELKVKELRGISTSAKTTRITPVSVPNSPFNIQFKPSFFISTTKNQQAYLSISWDAPDHNGYPITSYSVQVKRGTKKSSEGKGKKWKEIYTGVHPTFADPFTMGEEKVNAIYRIKAINKLGGSKYSQNISVNNVKLPRNSIETEDPGSNNNINNYTSNMKVKLPSKLCSTPEVTMSTLNLTAKEGDSPETEGILDIFSIRDAIEASIPPPLPNPWVKLQITESPNYIKSLEIDPNTNADINIQRFDYRVSQLQLPQVSFTPLYENDFPELPTPVADALSSLVAEDRRYSFNLSQLTKELRIAFTK